MSLCIVLVCVLGVALANPTTSYPEYQPTLSAQPPPSPQPVLAQPDLDVHNLESTSHEESKPLVIVTAIAVDSSEDQIPESHPEARFESQLESQIESQFESQFQSQPESQLEPQFESQFELQSESQLEPQFESQLQSQLEPQFESLFESQPESQQSSEESHSLDLESLYSETLKIITPSNHSTEQPQFTLPPVTSPRPATNSPPVVNKLVFKRITSAVPSTQVPSTSVPHEQVDSEPSSVESEIFGVKFFQSASTKSASSKTALAKPKSALVSFKPVSAKPVFITKNATLKTSTYWPATQKPNFSQHVSTEPNPPQSSLPQPIAPQLSLPQSSSTQSSQPRPSLPPLSQLQQFQHHPQATLPNSSPLQVQSYPNHPQAPPHSSPLHVYPQPYLHSTASNSNAPKTPSVQNPVPGRHEESIRSNLVLSGFGKLKPVQHFQPNHVPSQPRPVQHNKDNALDFLVSLGPLSFLTSPSKASPSHVSVPRNSSPLSEVEEKKGRSNNAPSLSLSSSKQHFSRSDSFEHRRPVVKNQPRHTVEEGDESRSISFSVDPPTVAAPLSILTQSRGSPTSVSFNLPRTAPVRREVEKENHQNEKLIEQGRSIPQPNSASLRLSHRPAIPDTRTARRIHNAAPPSNLALQEKFAAPVHPPHGTYQAKRPADYEFSYQVQGGYGGAPFGHQESREGPETRGSYVVPLPDGRVQRVTYYVSGNSGYRADVSYEGDAVYPHHATRSAYRNEPTHEGPAPAKYPQPRQPARNYRSEPEQPARISRSKPDQHAPTSSSNPAHQPAQVLQQYASESQHQPAQSTRGYRSVPPRATSFVSSSMFNINPHNQPASWPAA